MQVTLRKLSNNPNALRTDEVSGYAPRPPTVGEAFTVIAEGLSPGKTRLVQTSPVQSVDAAAGTFQTLNSTYGWEEVAA